MSSIPLDIASCFAVLRDLVIRHWDVDSTNEYFYGSVNDPFDLAPFQIDPKSLLTVTKLLTKDHHLVTCLTPEEVLQCDAVIQKLALDKYRTIYWYRSRQNDQTESRYTIKIAKDAKISINEATETKKPGFKEKIVIVKERFSGLTHTALEYTFPPEVLAVRRASI